MTWGRISKKTKERYKRRMKDVIKGLSRTVKVYTKSLVSECSNCYYDKASNSSTGTCKFDTPLAARDAQLNYETTTGATDLKFKYFRVGRCPICRGKGRLESYRRNNVDCLVTFNPGNTTFTPAGPEGSTVIELKTNPKYKKLFTNCEYVFIDNMKCLLSKPPMVRGIADDDSVLVITLFSNDGLNKIKTDGTLKVY